MKNKNQETDGYGIDKRPDTENLKWKEIVITEYDTIRYDILFALKN